MQYTHQAYQSEDDYWEFRQFLREIYLANQRDDSTWQVGRADYWRYFINVQIEHLNLAEHIFFWRNTNDKLVGAINSEDAENLFFQIHPAFRTIELETEMMTLAEARLGVIGEDGTRKLTIWTQSTDTLRIELLTERGYVRGEYPEYQFQRNLNTPIPDVPLAEGYSIRALGAVDELPARSWLSWTAFHPDEPDSAYEGWDWYLDVQRCPMYRRDLDLVVVAPDGELSAFCTVWFDDVTRTGMFEPVGTAPKHQKKGLGKAIMTEGLRRLQHLGATLACVGGYSEGAKTLYGGLFPDACRVYERWHKTVSG